MEFEPVRVTCYAGYKANESPRSFEWAGRTYKISQIIARWYHGGLDPKSEVTDYFKVRADEMAIFQERKLRKRK